MRGHRGKGRYATKLLGRKVGFVHKKAVTEAKCAASVLPLLAMDAARSGSSLPRVLVPLLLGLRVAVSQTGYFGNGYEQNLGGTRTILYKGLTVLLNEAAAANPIFSEQTIDDGFNWRAFEAEGYTTHVVGAEGWVPQLVQSWVPRTDGVRHGYFHIYQFDASSLPAGTTMADYFFSITVDVNVHPDYAASPVGQNANSSLRMSIYEAMPGDLSLTETRLPMINTQAAYLTDLQGGNADDLDTRRHRVQWGVDTGPGGGLAGTCTSSVPDLLVGIQCLQGFAFPQASCSVNPGQPPSMDDCNSYCPFTLTIRAIPRALTPGVPVETLMGPGQWQSFQLTAGAYDLLDVTIERAEYDNVTYGDMTWRDGFSGRVWLSRDSCIRGANVSVVEHHGYCPHGGALSVDPSTFEDIPPHRFCSRDSNQSYSVNTFGESYVRDSFISPTLGVPDDLGYSGVLDQIAERRAALEASMHYPTQLRIRAEMEQLELNLLGVSRSNATWQRRWPLRLCTTAADAGSYYLTIYADMAMDPRAHAGIFRVTYTNLAFSRAPLSDRTPRRGCLRRGTSEAFYLPTSVGAPEFTSLGLAEVRSFHVNDGSENHVTTLSVRRGEPPTDAVYDMRVAYPSLRTAMSACDVSAQQQWHFAVSLAADAAPTEVFFELEATLEDSTRSLGDSISGYTCCSQYKYYAFTGVSEHVAPLVNVNVTTGRIKTVYWRYDSCPREPVHVRDGICVGWCVLDWYRIYSSNLGTSQYRYASELLVPYGMGEATDKRRGGTWYLGIQALSEYAEYTLTTSSRRPPPTTYAGCSRFDPYCADWPNRFSDWVLGDDMGANGTGLYLASGEGNGTDGGEGNSTDGWWGSESSAAAAPRGASAASIMLGACVAALLLLRPPG